MDTKLTEALGKLADRIDHGHLLLSTDAVEFVKAITVSLDVAEAEIERLADGLQAIADGDWDADPSWYARELLGQNGYENLD